MDRQALRSATMAAGSLYLGKSAPETYLGTCFSFLKPTVFLSAAHCVTDIPTDEIWINHIGGPSPSLFTRALLVELDHTTDIAVIKTDAPRPQWTSPFTRVKYAADFGEEIFAFGFPQDLLSYEASKATPRAFRGCIQRPFLFQRSAYRYSAFELSFPCPPGLSGGPIFLPEDPATVLGIVTENFETYTVLHESQSETEDGRTTRFEARSVITYGVASNLFNGIELIEQVTGERVPGPISE